MRRMMLALLICVAVRGQTLHRISGVVVDSVGKPVPGARIDHGGGSGPYGPSTAADGHFALRTTSPALVVRKPGYQGYLLLTSADAVVRVVLQTAKPALPCVPVKVEGVVLTTGSDVDYSVTFETVDTPDGKASIMDGNGPMWSWGIPNSDDVWNSVIYSEVTRGEAASPVWSVDAKGVTAWGTYWRYSGTIGRSKSYRGVSKQAAAILDRVFDHGDCPN